MSVDFNSESLKPENIIITLDDRLAKVNILETTKVSAQEKIWGLNNYKRTTEELLQQFTIHISDETVLADARARVANIFAAIERVEATIEKPNIYKRLGGEFLRQLDRQMDAGPQKPRRPLEQLDPPTAAPFQLTIIEDYCQ